VRIVELTEHDRELLDRAVVRFRGVRGIEHGAFLGDPATLALVTLDDDGEVVGWAWGLRERHVGRYSQLLLYEIEVAGSARRQGVGRGLLDRLVEIARQEGHARMYLFTGGDNEPARALYEAAGGALSAPAEVGCSWRLR